MKIEDIEQKVKRLKYDCISRIQTEQDPKSRTIALDSDRSTFTDALHSFMESLVEIGNGIQQIKLQNLNNNH